MTVGHSFIDRTRKYSLYLHILLLNGDIDSSQNFIPYQNLHSLSAMFKTRGLYTLMRVKTQPQRECPEYDTTMHLIAFSFEDIWNVEYSEIHPKP